VANLQLPLPGLQPGHLAADWRDPGRNGKWIRHSVQQMSCTTALLFTSKLDAADASGMAGHANYGITLDMCVGTTAGILDRGRTATQ
jgi:hypothetical protein